MVSFFPFKKWHVRSNMLRHALVPKNIEWPLLCLSLVMMQVYLLERSTGIMWCYRVTHCMREIKRFPSEEYFLCAQILLPLQIDTKRVDSKTRPSHFYFQRYPTDRAYFIAKEILMTERTYKKDLEIINLVRLFAEFCWSSLRLSLNFSAEANESKSYFLQSQILSEKD